MRISSELCTSSDGGQLDEKRVIIPPDELWRDPLWIRPLPFSPYQFLSPLGGEWEAYADWECDGFYRELEREKLWSRIHLVPLLMAEGDRDEYRRQQAALAREKEIMKDVPGWEVRNLSLSPNCDRMLMMITIAIRAWRLVIHAGWQERVQEPQVRAEQYCTGMTSGCNDT